MALSHIWSPLLQGASAGGAPPITGTGAGTLGAITGSGSGVTWEAVTGTGAGTLGAVTGSGSGTVVLVFLATGAGTLGTITGSAVGKLGWRWVKATNGIPATTWSASAPEPTVDWEQSILYHEAAPGRGIQDPGFGRFFSAADAATYNTFATIGSLANKYVFWVVCVSNTSEENPTLVHNATGDAKVTWELVDRKTHRAGLDQVYLFAPSSVASENSNDSCTLTLPGGDEATNIVSWPFIVTITDEHAGVRTRVTPSLIQSGSQLDIPASSSVPEVILPDTVRPGSVVIAAGYKSNTASWNPVTRSDMTTRADLSITSPSRKLYVSDSVGSAFDLTDRTFTWTSTLNTLSSVFVWELAVGLHSEWSRAADGVFV